MSVAAKRESVKTLQDKYQVAESRACRVLEFPLSTFRYKSQTRSDEPIISKVSEIPQARPRFGMPRIHALLRRDGLLINKKRTERIYYRVLKLGLRKKRSIRRYRSEVRSPLANPQRKNQIWSMDFIADQLADRRRVRGLAIIDIWNRSSLAIDFDTSLTGNRVVQILERATLRYGKPEVISVDNGPEFICLAVDKWAYENQVSLRFSRPGTPTDNPFIESFNGKFRDEFLNMHCFKSLADLQQKATEWQIDYNENRPHSALGMLTPMEFTREATEKMAI